MRRKEQKDRHTQKKKPFIMAFCFASPEMGLEKKKKYREKWEYSSIQNALSVLHNLLYFVSMPQSTIRSSEEQRH